MAKTIQLTEMVNDVDLRRAAEIIRAGGLVAFPTETVYGLGANALDAEAVARIYAAKGRPASSPLIVHAAELPMVLSLIKEWPPLAATLAEHFWPGPLTIVLPKASIVPDTVTAGLPSVGIRMPAHPVAATLIREAGVPIAAPSANPFMGISPTSADHVRRSLPEGVDMVLDGGPSNVGIESTVVSLLKGEPVILRPGHITMAALATATQVDWRLAGETGSAQLSPGLHARHYAPRTPFYVLRPGTAPPSGRGCILTLPPDPHAYAAELYAALHRADSERWDWIATIEPPDEPDWAAIRDRLKRAGSWI